MKVSHLLLNPRDSTSEMWIRIGTVRVNVVPRAWEILRLPHMRCALARILTTPCPTACQHQNLCHYPARLIGASRLECPRLYLLECNRSAVPRYSSTP